MRSFIKILLFTIQLWATFPSQYRHINHLSFFLVSTPITSSLLRTRMFLLKNHQATNQQPVYISLPMSAANVFFTNVTEWVKYMIINFVVVAADIMTAFGKVGLRRLLHKLFCEWFAIKSFLTGRSLEVVLMAFLNLQPSSTLLRPLWRMKPLDWYNFGRKDDILRIILLKNR